MANPEHVEIVKQGATAIGEWRIANPAEDMKLDGSDLSFADLHGAMLMNADLRGANLSSANLSFADLSFADLSFADLSGTKMKDVNLSGAILRDAVLNRADLAAANLTITFIQGASLREAVISLASINGARLDQANLTKCVCGGTSFADVDLSEVFGLETVRHISESTIGIDTIYKSRGKIPEIFLRGCGVPDSHIAMIPALIGAMEPIQFYSCFISYSHKDEDFAQRLHSRLRDEKLRVWYAPEDIKGGRKLHEQIEEAIRIHDRLLLVLSDASMSSEWVRTEIYKARQREIREGKRVLFPVRLVPFERIRQWEAFDADSGKDMAREIREYFIPDFSNWKDQDAFEAGFKRLLSDLRSEVAKP